MRSSSISTPDSNTTPANDQSADAPITTAIERAMDWLVASGIQAKSEDPGIDGGFACWYDESTRSSPYLYSEITGYMLTLFGSLIRDYDDAFYLRAATNAGDWLARTVHSGPAAFLCLTPLANSRFDYKSRLLYTFDCGVILNGLANLYRVTHVARYVEIAQRAADWLIGDAQTPSGFFHATYDANNGGFAPASSGWSERPGGYQSKIAIGLCNLFDLTSDTKYIDAAVRLCDRIIDTQDEEGCALIPVTHGWTNLHPMAYAAEGLWVAGKYLQRAEYLDASVRSIQWMLEFQTEDGHVPRHVSRGRANYSERYDIIAQALRLAVIHRCEQRLDDRHNSNIVALLKLLLRNQAVSADPRVDGAFYFGRESNGTLLPHANSWVTAFAIQALCLYRDGAWSTLFQHPFDLV